MCLRLKPILGLYTERQVRRLLRSLALSLAVALAALPAASLACQVMCAPVTGHADHRAMHGHAADAAEVGHGAAEAPSLSARAERCDESFVVTTSVLRMGIQLPPPPV